MYFPKPASTTSARPPPVNVTEENYLEVIPKNDSITTAAPNATQWTAVETTDMNANMNEGKIDKEPPKTNNVTNVNITVSPVNLTETLNMTKKKNLTRPDFVNNDSSIESALESRIVTDKPLSLETTYLQTRIPPNIELYRRVDNSEGGMDTGAIAGISFAALVLAALAGSTAFVLYRRRYLNKPQTLNDKCSNPDSSGYLDDSTIRVGILVQSSFAYFYFLHLLILPIDHTLCNKHTTRKPQIILFVIHPLLVGIQIDYK